jgi:hypothetical protein
MHRSSDMAEFEWQAVTATSAAVVDPVPPAEKRDLDEPMETPRTRRVETFGGPVELLGQQIPQVLCDARDPDEDEDDDMDYLYDDEDEDLDDDLDEDLDEFEEEEEEFEEEDEDL